jgi:hypothetical protein
MSRNIPVQLSAALILSMSVGTLSKLQSTSSGGERFTLLRQSSATGGLGVKHIEEGKLRITQNSQWRDGWNKWGQSPSGTKG